MVAIGFMFMGAVSLSGLAPDGQPQQEGQQEIDAELPEQNYQEGGFDLGVNEQIYLSLNNRVVFVNAIYEEDSEVFDDLQGFEEEFDGKVYFTTVHASESRISTEVQVSEYPEIVVVGDQPTGQTAYTLRRVENDRESVMNAVCDSMRDVGSAAAVCF